MVVALDESIGSTDTFTASSSSSCEEAFARTRTKAKVRFETSINTLMEAMALQKVSRDVEELSEDVTFLVEPPLKPPMRYGRLPTWMVLSLSCILLGLIAGTLRELID
jgi:hypothetical protein